MRIRYNRASVVSAINAAKRIAQTQTCYVIATANGYQISNEPAPFGKRCVKVTANNVENIGQW